MLRAAAPAKLNLTLHITGKRADGYHEIESLVVFTELADELTATPADSLSLKVEGAFADLSGSVTDNLVLKAAHALQAKTGCSKGAALTLIKHIPVGAGLGGGSADAAAALRLLNALWQLQLGEDVLHAIATTLGADVAMCLVGQPLIARGVGEVVEPLTEFPALHAVLVYPNTPLATVEVYRAYRHDPLRVHAQAMDYMHGRNDLQQPAITLLPEIAHVLLALKTEPTKPLLARMTGSGACCFALFNNVTDALAMESRVRSYHPDWWVSLTQLRELRP